MAATRQCVASMASLSLSSSIARPTVAAAAPTIPRFLAPSATQQMRWKTKSHTPSNAMAVVARQREKEKLKKKRRMNKHKEYKFVAPSRDEQWSVCDAMRYIRASQVGLPTNSITYEISMKVRTIKNGPVLRNRVRFPNPVKNDTRIAVICREGSGAMNDARSAGAVAFGEESLFKIIREKPNDLPFNRLLCHQDSEGALKKAGLGRILGPRGMMPSLKTNTLVRSVKIAVRDLVGAEQYRERVGVIRLAVGNITFTPKMLSENIKTLVQSVQEDIVVMEDKCRKDLVEIVLSSTTSPGFPLSGVFNSVDEKLTPDHLSTAM